MSLTTLKWGSTFLVLTGILIAQFNLYPIYLYTFDWRARLDDVWISDAR